MLRTHLSSKNSEIFAQETAVAPTAPPATAAPPTIPIIVTATSDSTSCPPKSAAYVNGGTATTTTPPELTNGGDHLSDVSEDFNGLHSSAPYPSLPSPSHPPPPPPPVLTTSLSISALYYSTINIYAVPSHPLLYQPMML